MKCPHCLVSFHDTWKPVFLETRDADAFWYALYTTCSACHRYVIRLDQCRNHDPHTVFKSTIVYPKSVSRSPLPQEIPEQFADDYKEACLVFPDSQKASAALSRRCLQHLLREKANVTKGSLDSEIQQVLDSKQLPTYLADAIDAVRAIGNFAAHPIKSTNTGEVVEVEPGEAEWLLDTLEGLFDFRTACAATAEAGCPQ